MIARFIEIHEVKYFASDIKTMDKNQIKTICSFLDNENDLLFIQNNCQEDFKYIVDNIIFKL